MPIKGFEFIAPSLGASASLRVETNKGAPDAACQSDRQKATCGDKAGPRRCRAREGANTMIRRTMLQRAMGQRAIDRPRGGSNFAPKTPSVLTALGALALPLPHPGQICQ